MTSPSFERVKAAATALGCYTDGSYHIEALAGRSNMALRRALLGMLLGVPAQTIVAKSASVGELRAALYAAVPANLAAGCEAAVRADFAQRCCDIATGSDQTFAPAWEAWQAAQPFHAATDEPGQAAGRRHEMTKKSLNGGSLDSAAIALAPHLQRHAEEVRIGDIIHFADGPSGCWSAEEAPITAAMIARANRYLNGDWRPARRLEAQRRTSGITQAKVAQ